METEKETMSTENKETKQGDAPDCIMYKSVCIKHFPDVLRQVVSKRDKEEEEELSSEKKRKQGCYDSDEEGESEKGRDIEKIREEIEKNKNKHKKRKICTWEVKKEEKRKREDEEDESDEESGDEKRVFKIVEMRMVPVVTYEEVSKDVIKWEFPVSKFNEENIRKWKEFIKTGDDVERKLYWVLFDTIESMFDKKGVRDKFCAALKEKDALKWKSIQKVNEQALLLDPDDLGRLISVIIYYSRDNSVGCADVFYYSVVKGEDDYNFKKVFRAVIYIIDFFYAIGLSKKDSDMLRAATEISSIMLDKRFRTDPRNAHKFYSVSMRNYYDFSSNFCIQ